MNAGFFSLFHFATADYILVLNVRNTHNNSKCCLSLFSMLPQASSTQRNLSYAHKPIRNINRSVRRVISFLCVCILKSFITFRGFCYVCTRTCMNSSMHLFLLSLHILSVKLALVMIVFFCHRSVFPAEAEAADHWPLLQNWNQQSHGLQLSRCFPGQR